MRKLSRIQEVVILKMQEGWELGDSRGMTGHQWLQKNGCGYGGETLDMRSSTFYALIDKGLIQIKVEKFPTNTYKLTQKGKDYKGG